MELQNIVVGNGLTLESASNPLPEKSFKELIDIVNECYRKIGINPSDMNMEYQRFPNANSVLAIKMTPGSNYDKENYMFIGSAANKYGEQISCDVFMHADAKSAQNAIQVSNMISRNIVSFFEQTEQHLEENGMSDMEFAISIPMSQEHDNSPNQNTKQNKEQFLKRFIKRIRKK